ncbi:membrane protein insertion efficiency factor YidD [Brachybacterium muris]|uniref:membrane protein insertion efficiency factor YidD n=1 Tax=Brachybacterium muris TaxID=219301 RepID=UPI00195D706F|nr:membrane protein insertion efficiency factor YidD [Brachybacterium muris]MBM7502388.1 putative membrane protein insertion efficiency factor [Brachybacterium muris]MCT1429457.1 membrane protein insertion efficiency factor YidD [Brachybacterium muris]MCT1653298.1 membrane protein insertion efficiency factor YidD [Brachybacterium muris]MCT1996920.1 membrane protein insertion efficiency factor YidD [Brachybacterium muris]MCT2294921.1 membrane protein insertion efficiency factor YidD [Brachybact
MPATMRSLARLPRRLLALPVRAYQVGISPYTPPACRFYPVCSQYGMDALRVHGAVKGTALTAWRILRCNPLTRGGPDPVPAPGMWSNPRRLRTPAR